MFGIASDNFQPNNSLVEFANSIILYIFVV